MPDPRLFIDIDCCGLIAAGDGYKKYKAMFLIHAHTKAFPTMPSDVLLLLLTLLAWRCIQVTMAQATTDVTSCSFNETWVRTGILFALTSLTYVIQEYNEEGQNPCLVYAYALSSCYGSGEMTYTHNRFHILTHGSQLTLTFYHKYVQ